jgi:hypothetical protein
MSEPLPPDGLVAAITRQVRKRAIFVCSNLDCRAAHSRKGQRYCGACHADYQQVWRAKQKDGVAETRARHDALTAELAANPLDSRHCAACGEYMPPHAPHMCANWPPAASELEAAVSRAIRRAPSAADRPRREG